MNAPSAAFPVDALELALSLRCNLACAYCLRHGRTEEMGPATARAALDLLFARPAARKDLTFTGGEPLLLLDRVKALAAEARARARAAGTRLRLNVLTNGTRVDARALDFLDAEDVRVFLSVGGAPESHDRFRRGAGGGDTWPRVERTARALAARLPPACLVATFPVHPALVHRLRADFRFLVGLGLRHFNVCAVYGAPWTARQAAELASQYAGVVADAAASARSGDPVVLQALGMSLKRFTGTTPHYDYRDDGGTHCPLSFRLTAWPDGTLSLNPFRFGPSAAEHAVGRLDRGWREPFASCAGPGPSCDACRRRVVELDRGYGADYVKAHGVDPEGFRRSYRANVLLCDGALNRAAADRLWEKSAGDPALRRYVEACDAWTDLVG